MNSIKNFSTVGLAQQVVTSLIAGRTMFTAHDVTKKVRALVGRATNVPHDTIRDAVHQMYYMGAMGADYSRTSLAVGDGGEVAFVYHHYTENPHDYLNIINVPAPAATTAPDPALAAPLPQLTAGNPVATTTAAPAPAANNNTVRQTSLSGRGLDRFNRLRVPAKSLSDAGFRAGDVAYVVTGANGDLTFYRSRPSGVDAKTYMVDCYNNIRMKLPQGAPSKFSFASSQGKVTAQPVP